MLHLILDLYCIADGLIVPAETTLEPRVVNASVYILDKNL